MKTLFTIIIISTCLSSTNSQVFLAKALIEEFYFNENIAYFLKETGFTKISSADLPKQMNEQLIKMTNLIGNNTNISHKYYYYNTVNQSFLVYGVDEEDVLVYGLNFFNRDQEAINKIKNYLDSNNIIYIKKEGLLSFYAYEESELCILGLQSDGMVIFAYISFFED